MVYIVKENGTDFVKIGVAINIENRIVGLQIGNPRELELIKSYKGGYAIETLIHKKYKDLHVRGEWFIFDESMLSIDIDSLKDYNKKLLKYIKHGHSVKELADIFNKTPEFILIKLFELNNSINIESYLTDGEITRMKLAVFKKMYKNGSSIADINEKTGLDTNFLLLYKSNF